MDLRARHGERYNEALRPHPAGQREAYQLAARSNSPTISQPATTPVALSSLANEPLDSCYTVFLPLVYFYVYTEKTKFINVSFSLNFFTFKNRAFGKEWMNL